MIDLRFFEISFLISFSSWFVFLNPFDEDTSALINITEKEVRENPEDYMKDCTVSQVVHRLSTLKNCDKIIMFDQNQIFVTRAYDHLLSRKVLFSKLNRATQSVQLK
jgi:ABC-type bacteriocin/lantibiotic exporter with double-glycine peptidase domain